MKYLLVLAVLMVAFWLWRNGRRQDQADAARQQQPAPRPEPGAPQPMARCATCGLHLPQADALPGPDGWYCSAEHRARPR
ncbi:MAG: hypothetical protein KA795_15415 [Burkholderiaceae bacterium]|nr:hypothetical protein [Burkholderiaceae bacterium]